MWPVLGEGGVAIVIVCGHTLCGWVEGGLHACFARCRGTLLSVCVRERERVNMCVCRCVHQHMHWHKHITRMWLSCCICQSLITHRLLPPDYQHFTFHHLSCTVPLNESTLAGPLCCLHDGIAVHVCVCVYQLMKHS